jgi:hypothetical protein
MTMLHIHCGDSSADALRQAGAPGDVIAWCDPLFDGPLGRDWPDATRRRIRAAHLSGTTRGAMSPAQCERWLHKQDMALARFREHDEVVLWFDACLFDQSILVRQLAWFADQDLDDTRLSLICIGTHPAVPRFRGLGELAPSQLLALLPARAEVTGAQCRLGRAAWQAWCAPGPEPLNALARLELEPLPFLREAAVRRIQQYPSIRTGLNRLEQESLEALEDGPMRPAALFRAVSDREARPFFGDTTLWACLDAMSRAEPALVSIEGPGPLPLWEPVDIDRWLIALTSEGRRALAGDLDRTRLQGYDAWIGGVHLRRGSVPWRWDPDQDLVVWA